MKYDKGGVRKGTDLRGSSLPTVVNASVHMQGEASQNFGVSVGVRQDSAMLFKLLSTAIITEIKATVRDLGNWLKVRGLEKSLMAGLFVEVVHLLKENERILQRTMNESDGVLKGRKMKVNVDRSKVMVLERAKEQTTDFDKTYRDKAEGIKDTGGTMRCKARHN